MLFLALAAEPGGTLRLDLRGPRAASLPREIPASRTAIIICDMWDRHWCRGAEERVGVLARRMEPVLEHARKRGILIIHAPSSTMAFYKDAPQRLRMLAIPKVDPPASLGLTDPPLPIDDSDGGCDSISGNQPVNTNVWTRENAALSIGKEDLISDDGREVYSALRQHGVDTVFLMGVHANMCILNRSFAIRQMTNWGIHCILVRDLTDAMYNPKARPFVSHERGTEMVIEHIEKYWAPTIVAADLIR